MAKELSEKMKKILILIFRVIGIMIIIGIFILLRNYFSKQVYYSITVYNSYNVSKTYDASSIIYYGYDIGYDPNFDYDNDDWYEENVHLYSGREYTNGIICIYALHSKWDWKNNDSSDIPLYIVGNVARVHHILTDSDRENFDNEIDKYWYQDCWDSHYEY